MLLHPDAADLLIGTPLIYRLHILLGFTIFLVSPFTRLVHVWSAPVWYLGRPGFQVVRRRQAAGNRLPAVADRVTGPGPMPPAGGALPQSATGD